MLNIPEFITIRQQQNKNNNDNNNNKTQEVSYKLLSFRYSIRVKDKRHFPCDGRHLKECGFSCIAKNIHLHVTDIQQKSHPK